MTYDPTIGRWLSPDPLENANPTQTPYTYCGNNPLNKIDPSGNLELPAQPRVIGPDDQDFGPLNERAVQRAQRLQFGWLFDQHLTTLWEIRVDYEEQLLRDAYNSGRFGGSFEEFSMMAAEYHESKREDWSAWRSPFEKGGLVGVRLRSSGYESQILARAFQYSETDPDWSEIFRDWLESAKKTHHEYTMGPFSHVPQTVMALGVIEYITSRQAFASTSFGGRSDYTTTPQTGRTRSRSQVPKFDRFVSESVRAKSGGRTTHRSSIASSEGAPAGEGSFPSAVPKMQAASRSSSATGTQRYRNTPPEVVVEENAAKARNQRYYKQPRASPRGEGAAEPNPLEVFEGEGGALRSGSQVSNAPRRVAPKLPPYAGGKTSGVLRHGDTDLPLLSGYKGPSASMPKGSVPGMHGRIKSHVEAHAASVTRVSTRCSDAPVR